MHISGHSNNYVEITIPFEEVRRMLIDKDEESLSEFANHLRKYYTWINDKKKIRTRRLLNYKS
jgi:hypothetical protein